MTVQKCTRWQFNQGGAMKSTRQILSQDKKKIAAFAVSLAAVAALTVPMSATTSAAPLDNLDLTVASSSHDEDGNQSGGALRVVAADQLENIGLGLNGYSMDEDGAHSKGSVMVESTDYLENVSAMTDAKSVDEDGAMSHNKNTVTTTDYLENTDVQSWTHTVDEDGNTSNLGAIVKSHDYGEDAGLGLESMQTADGDVTNTGIRFGFED